MSRTCLADRHDPVFQDTRPEPFLDQANDASIADPVLNKSDEPCLVDRVEEAPDIRIEDVVHFSAADSDDQRVQRIVLAAFRSESIREPEKLHLVDRVQQCCHGALDDLVLKRSDSERALPTIWLRYIPSL